MFERELQLVLTLKDQATKGLAAFSEKNEKLVEASNTVAKAVSVASLAMGALGVSSLMAASDNEQLEVSFKTLLGSAEEAQSFIAKMKSFAKATPFETSDIAKAAQTMLAFGISSKDVMGDIQMIGDVAMGNKVKFDSLSLAFAQVQSTGRLMGQDMLQMINQGFNPLKIMSEQTGKSMADLKKEMESGAISADMVSEAFRVATSEGGLFYGGMAAQSQTLAGKVSTLKDEFTALKVEIGDKLKPVAVEIVGKMTEMVGSLENITKFVNENKTAITVAAGAISGAIIGSLIPSFTAWAITMWTVTLPALGAVLLGMAPFIIGGALIGGIIAGIYLIVKNWDWISAKATEVWGAISGFMSATWASITSSLTTAWNGIMGFLSGIWEGIKMVFSTYAALAVGIVIAIFDAFGIDIVSVLGNIALSIQSAWENIKSFFVSAGSAISAVWSSTWTAIGNFLGPVWNNIKSVVSASWKWLKDTFTALSVPLTEAWGSLWAGLTSTVTAAWEGVKNTVKDSINWIIGKINALINAANAVAAKGASAIGIDIVKIPNIPMLAQGGIVTKPTLAMIGEGGEPEAVIPLSKMGSTGGMTVNITVNGDVSGRDLVEKVKEALAGDLRLNMAL